MFRTVHFENFGFVSIFYIQLLIESIKYYIYPIEYQ